MSFNEIRHLKNCKNKLLLYTVFLKLFDDDVLEHSILEQISFMSCLMMFCFNIVIMLDW